MSTLAAVMGNALPEASSTPGITRHLAFKGDDYLVLRARSDPGTVPGWHHHSGHDVFGYVVSGSARLEAEAGEAPISLSAGDFFHVPANAIHRETNPSPDTPNEIILFLRGSGPLVVNVEQHA